MVVAFYAVFAARIPAARAADVTVRMVVVRISHLDIDQVK